jgi:hypothetical protein
MKNLKKPINIIKAIKKLQVKTGDIVVVTLKGYPSSYQVDKVREECEAMPFMRNVELIIATEKIDIKKGKIHGGKHQVFLDNLEYLEYLAKHKGV